MNIDIEVSLKIRASDDPPKVPTIPANPGHPAGSHRLAPVRRDAAAGDRASVAAIGLPPGGEGPSTFPAPHLPAARSGSVPPGP